MTYLYAHTTPAPRAPLGRASWLFALLFLFASCTSSPDAGDAPAEHGEHDTHEGPDDHHDEDPEHTARILARLHMTEAQPAQRIRVASLVAEAFIPADARWQIGPGALVRIDGWDVGIGDVVEIGTPLAKLINYDQSDLSGQVTAARAVVAQRRAVLQSREEAKAHGVITAAEVEEARASLAEAEAQSRALQRSSRARSGGAAHGDGVWRSPVSGVIASLDCAPGSVVEIDRTCLMVLDLERAVIRVHVPEKLSTSLADNIQGEWVAWGSSEAQGPLRILRRAPSIDPHSRTQAVDFQSETPLVLLPGQSGRLDLYQEAEASWVELPRTALTALGGEDVVFVPMDDHDLPEPLAVRIISRFDDRVVVESSELSEGSPVVERGVFLLRSLAIAELGGGHSH